jgi:hypothetical protein
VGTQNREEHQEKLLKVSSARCARVSYLNFQQKRSKPEEDLELFEKLHTDPLHASALEHPCQGDLLVSGQWQSPELHGNFEGCIQYRKLFANECYLEDVSRTLQGKDRPWLESPSSSKMTS